VIESKRGSDLPNLQRVSGCPGELAFDLNWTMTTLFCSEHFLEDSPQKKLRLTKLRELVSFVAARQRSLYLDESHAQDVMNLLESGLFRRLWEVDAKVLRSDAGELAKMLDSEHAELMLLYRLLLEVEQLPVFAARMDLAFIVSIAENLRSIDAEEQKQVAAFLREVAERSPELREKIKLHLLAMLHDMTRSEALIGVGTVIRLLERLAGKQARRVIVEHVFPLLGNARLRAFVSDLGPWLCALADAEQGQRAALAAGDFREELLEALIRRFPLTDRGSALASLQMIEHVAVAVPTRLVPRLLAIVAWGLEADDEETNALATAVLKSANIGRVLDGVRVRDAAPLLETLVAGRGPVIADALQFVSGRRRLLAAEFGKSFSDRDAVACATWTAIAEHAGVAFDAESVPSRPAVANLAACPSALARLQAPSS
jgi:hypothetical protein